MLLTLSLMGTVMSEATADRIASALDRIATVLESGAHINIDHGHIEHIDHVDHIDAIEHTHIDDIGEIHGDVVTHPKQF